VNPLLLSCAAFAVILCGIIGGMLLRNVLPGHHLAGETKDVVRLGTGLIATIGGLVLGPLIASAKSSFDTQSSQINVMTANIILLDRILVQYGPEAGEARELLRRSLPPLVERIWRNFRRYLQRTVRARRRRRGSVPQNPGPFAAE